MGDVKFVWLDVVQELVDAAEVVGGDVDFLAEKALAHILLAENFRRFEQERAGTTGGVIDFVDLCFSSDGNAREQLRNFLRGEKFTAAFAGIGRIHGHDNCRVSCQPRLR